MKRPVIKTKRKLYKSIIFLIFCEFIFTSLGFCGHSHNHQKHYQPTLALGQLQNQYSDSHHSHSTSGHTRKDKSDAGDKYHCSCLGNFLSAGILKIDFITLHYTKFIYQETSSYTSLMEDSLFHPPRYHQN
ncbi:MAG: hypothetical protein R6V04_11145 [bacterium]